MRLTEMSKFSDQSLCGVKAHIHTVPQKEEEHSVIPANKMNQTSQDLHVSRHLMKKVRKMQDYLDKLSSERLKEAAP